MLLFLYLIVGLCICLAIGSSDLKDNEFSGFGVYLIGFLGWPLMLVFVGIGILQMIING